MKLRERRIARLKREIALLEGMSSRLWWKAALLSALAIPICAGVTYFILHKLVGHDSLALFAAVAGVTAVVWWLGTYSLYIPVAVLFLAIAVVFEDAPDLPDWSSGNSDGEKTPQKSERERKIEAALAKRRLKLLALESQKPT